MNKKSLHYHLLIILIFCCTPGISSALEFMPYPVAKITNEQWQAFYTEARTKLAHSQRVYTAQHMVVFVDSFNGHHYSFTLPGHAAHPSWIARRIVNQDGIIDIQQIGYYVNDEAAFVELYKAYLELNAQTRPRLQDRN